MRKKRTVVVDGIFCDNDGCDNNETDTVMYECVGCKCDLCAECISHSEGFLVCKLCASFIKEEIRKHIGLEV